jgi:MFS family permease
VNASTPSDASDSRPGALSPAGVLTLHALSMVLTQSSWTAMTFILPVVARKHFDATPGQVLLVTMAPLVLASVSIFWGALLQRTTIGLYLLIYWAVSALPLVGLAATTSFWPLLALHLVSSLGYAAWSSANGELVKRLYGDASRGRAYAVLTTSSMLGGAGLSALVGRLLTADPESFRWYMPALVFAQLLGVLLLAWLVRRTGAERAGVGERWTINQLLEPIVHMRGVLAKDRVFFRYEAAFMTYGVGWMICFALVPLIVTDKLKLDYNTIASSTAVAMLLATVTFTLPFGMLNDKIGPVRTSAVAFGLYVAYPLLLIWATDATQLTIASVVYGICSAGANVGWLLGPVSLAPTHADVPRYVAIHATLVGLRGTVFQGVGVGLYALTGSFTPALILAAIGFAWASWQMVQLARVLPAKIGGRAPASSSSSSPASSSASAEAETL